ncbi:phage tail protein [Streptosporangium canum]
MAEGFKIADAFVEVHARGHDRIGNEVRDEVRGDRSFDDAGADAGGRFATGFIRDANGRLHDARGRFVAEGLGAGEGFGRGFGDGVDRERGGLVGRLANLGVSLGGSLTRGLLGSIGGIGSLLGTSLTRGLLGPITQIGSALTSALKLSVLAGGIATVGAAAASSASYLLLFVGELLPLGGLLATLPGLLMTGTAALITWKLATYGVGEAMGAVWSGDAKALEAALAKLTPAAAAFVEEFQRTLPALKEFQAAAQTGFFSELNGSLAHFADLLKETQPWIQGLAVNMGALVRTFLEWATSSRSIAGFNTILGNTSSLVTAIRLALQPLLTGFLDLAVVGSNWLSSFAPGLRGVLTTFGQWMSKVSAGGQAMQWMNDAVDVLRQLWQVAKDFGGIISGVLRAIQSDGQSALGIIGTLLDGMHKFVDSARGQEILKTIFGALFDIGKVLVPVIRDLAAGLATVAPLVAELAKLIGPILQEAINAVAPALRELGPGLITLFSELGKAVKTLADSGALTDIARAISDIMIAVAPLLPALATILAPTLQFLAGLISNYVAPALETLVGWIQQAVDSIKGGGISEDTWLGRVGAAIRDAVVPMLQDAAQFIGKVFDDIVKWFTENKPTVEEWGERIISIITKVGDVWGLVWETIRVVWDKFGGPLLDLVGNVFSGILKVIDGALTAIKGLWETVLGVLTGDWDRAWEGIKMIFSGVWDAIVAILETVFNSIKIQLGTFVDDIDQKWDTAWTAVKDFFVRIWDDIVKWVTDRVRDVIATINWFHELPGKVDRWFGELKDAAIRKATELVDWIRGLPTQIMNALGNLNSLLHNSGQSILQGLIDGMWSKAQEAYNSAAEILNRIRSLFPFSPAREGPFSGQGWTLYSGRSLAEGFAEGMSGKRGVVSRAADDLTNAAVIGVASVGAAGPALAPTGAAAASAEGQGRSLHIGSLVFNLHGVLDFRNPTAATRQIVLDLREQLRRIEGEYA